MIIMDPEKIPAEPNPAIALPAMKTADVGAAAQIVDPISKMTMLVRYVLSKTDIVRFLQVAARSTKRN
jgi:hypothetical protein